MKKLFALLLVVVMVFSLCACSNTGDNGETNPNTEAKSAAELVSDAFIDPINGWAEYDELIAQIKA